MRKLYVHTDMMDDLLNIELDVIKQFNIQSDEDYTIDVFNEQGQLVTVLENIKSKPHPS
jgi:6-pyruvoyl-tetrahydropterin synthase